MAQDQPTYLANCFKCLKEVKEQQQVREAKIIYDEKMNRHFLTGSCGKCGNKIHTLVNAEGKQQLPRLKVKKPKKRSSSSGSDEEEIPILKKEESSSSSSSEEKPKKKREERRQKRKRISSSEIS